MLGLEKSLRPIHFYERVCVNNLRFSPLIRSSNPSHLVLDLYNLVFVIEYKKNKKNKKKIKRKRKRKKELRCAKSARSSICLFNS